MAERINKQASTPQEIQARNQLVMENMGLVYAYLNRIPWLIRPGALHDDLVQQVALGLMRAAELYDPAVGAFSTYAWTWVRQFVGRYIRRQEIPHVVVSGKSMARLEEFGHLIPPGGEPPGLLEQLCAADSRQHEMRQLQDACRHLPEKERNIFFMRVSGYTLLEIAQQVGVSKERIRQRLAFCYKRIAQRLGIKPGDISGVRIQQSKPVEK